MFCVTLNLKCLEFPTFYPCRICRIPKMNVFNSLHRKNILDNFLLISLATFSWSVSAPITTAGLGDLWWIFLIVALILLLLILLTCCCICLQRNKGDSYPGTVLLDNTHCPFTLLRSVLFYLVSALWWSGLFGWYL